MDLLLAPFLARLILVEPAEVAVIALVERLIARLGQAGLAEFGERQGERVLGANQRGGVGDIEAEAARLEPLTRRLGFLDAERA